MNNGIIRTVKKQDYHPVNNAPFRDERLSWEARGVLAYFLTRPDDWVVRNGDLINGGPAGRKKIERILNELTECGYLSRHKVRNDDGTFEWVTQVYESPALNPHHTPQKGVWTIPPLANVGEGGDILSKESLKENNNKKKESFDEHDDLQQIAWLIRFKLDGGGDDIRRARGLYYEHRGELSLTEIAEKAVNSE